MTEDWLNRWQIGKTGWHEEQGNASLKTWWPELPAETRVLVPLCGKTVDLLWLARRGLDVTGVELSTLAAKAFFDDNRLEYRRETVGSLDCWRAVAHRLSIYCGDYFTFEDVTGFDAVYDRAALIAMAPDRRPAYAAHTRGLLNADARHLLITLEYDQRAVAGPPYSVGTVEVERYWPELQIIEQHDDLANAPPKFREAGLDRLVETAWINR